MSRDPRERPSAAEDSVKTLGDNGWFVSGVLRLLTPGRLRDRGRRPGEAAADDQDFVYGSHWDSFVGVGGVVDDRHRTTEAVQDSLLRFADHAPVGVDRADAVHRRALRWY
ncbi:hypothetical protein OHB12_04020 [Nocardia sp. NBC_01730]|uniref:hypothetical protein n=1 Tax=Nocardia sp. NBC_01730 TaxID=2975998 RepID=UPI002E1523F1|nr:hypothetical protein OHB12_04020 [Nocardia sp. NBC_01730]